MDKTEKSNQLYLKHLASIVELSEDSIISKSLDGTIESWNKGSEKMFGYTEEEAVGKNISLIIPLEYLGEEKTILEKMLNNEVIEHYETIRNKKNGEQLYVSLSISPIKDDEGNIIGVSKITRDITSRKKIEQELALQSKEKEKYIVDLLLANKEMAFQEELIMEQEKTIRAKRQLEDSDAKYKSLYQSNPMPMSIFDVETLQFLSVNDAFVEKYGYSKDEFLSMTILDIRPDSEAEKVKNSVIQTDTGLVNVGVFLHKKKSGEIIHVEIIRRETIFDNRRAKLVLVNEVTDKIKAENDLLKTNIELRIAKEKAEKNEIVLQEKEHFLRSMTDNIPGMLGYWTADLRCSFANKGYQDWFGHTQEQMLGLSMQELMGEELFKKNESYIRAALDGRNQYFERELIKPNGEKGYLLAQYIANILDDKVVGFFALITDISTIKQAEIALMKSEESLNMAQEIAKIGSWEFDLVSLALTWSKEHYHIFELEEMPADKLYVAYRSKIHPEDIPKLDQVVEYATEKGIGFTYEHRVLCRDGSTKYVLGIGDVIKDDSGKPKLIRGTIQDITERKIQEYKLIELNEKQKVILEETQRVKQELQARMDVLERASLLTETDLDGNLTYANANFLEISKYTLEEVIGRPHNIIRHSDNPPSLFREMWKTIKAGDVFHAEYPNRAKDGSTYWIDATIAPVLDSEGKPYKYIGIRFDVTKRKQAEEKNSEQNKALREIAFFQSHILRRPVANVIGLLDLIDEERKENSIENIYLYLDLLKQAITETDEVIQQIVTKVNEIE